MTTDTKHTWQNAVSHAAKYANLNGSNLAIAENFLSIAGHADHTFGIETINECDRTMSYLNTGETYDLTVCCENGTCFALSWGDWLELAERRYGTENNVTRCPACGEWTSYDRVQLSCTCEYCGYSVFE